VCRAERRHASAAQNEKVEQQLAEKPHRVLRLEDVDGDGVFDGSCPPFGPLAIGAIVLLLYGCLYLGLAALTGVLLPGLRRR
jgi:hypothetical protein